MSQWDRLSWQRVEELTRPTVIADHRQRRSVADSAHAGVGTLLVPLGSTEQHGPHLPLRTDTVIATEIARRAAEADSRLFVAPAVPYGASGEHAQFPGTLSIGTPALKLFLIELGRSAVTSVARVVFVNGHGGNADAVRAAVELLRSEDRNVRAWSPSGYRDAHAGRTETSLMLALHPELVGPYDAIDGVTDPVAVLMPRLQACGVAAVSPSGVLGDPAGASAAEGETLLRRWSQELVEFCGVSH